MELVLKHIILRIEAKKPPTELELKPWVLELVEKIGMTILAGPISADVTTIPGNCGPTCVCIIETSHIAMHIWDEPKPALMQMDVYRCGDFSPTDICNKIMKDFDVTKIEYKYLNRETGLVDL